MAEPTEQSAGHQHPLITLFVIAYKQEAYIREAIEGAFAQTFQPLEILLSDDASPDRTYDIMQDMAAGYRGSHRVVLNRNPKNLGLIRHLERIMQLASGEFVVQNAGDDVSEPDRVSKLVSAWLASGRSAKLVHSPALIMDEDGNLHGIRPIKPLLLQDPSPLEVLTHNLTGTGAMYGWSRDLFDHFGGLGKHLIVEDFCLTYRAAALGGIRFVNEPLLRKRVGGLSITHRHFLGRDYLFGSRLKHKRWDAGNRRQFLQDLDILMIPEAEACRVEGLRQLEPLEFEIGLADANPIERLKMLPRALMMSMRTGRFFYIRQALKYLFSEIYISYLDARNRHRSLPTDFSTTPIRENLRCLGANE